MKVINLFYSVLFVVSWINLSTCLSMTGSFNTPLQVSVSIQNDAVIRYPYVESLNTNDTYLRVFVEAVMEVNDSVLIIMKISDEVVKYIKLSNDFNMPILKAERSICPSKTIASKMSLMAFISSSSSRNVSVKIEIKIINNFTLRFDEQRTFKIDDMSPVFLQVRFNKMVEQITVRVESPNKSCMMLSIQEGKCPVRELLDDVKFTGVYQSVTLKGSIVLQARNYKSNTFYVVFVHNSNNGFCSDGPATSTGIYSLNEKEITVTISSTSNYTKYLYVNLVVLGIYLAFFVVALLVSMKIYSYPEESICCGGSGSNEGAYSIMKATKSLNTDSIDNLNEEDPTIQLPNPYKDNYLYIWILAILSAFYSIPVIQLFITNLQMMQNSGNTDTCFYNFYCLRPLYRFYAFNNILSNIGYVIIGCLTIIITYMKHRFLGNFSPFYTDKNQRLHNDFSIFYAMGLTMIMEGIMSALYHVCPTKDNFQFDTTYMYIMVGLCIVRIQKARLPDMNTTAKFFYLVIAGIVIMGVIGQRNDHISFWIVFIIINVPACFVVTVRWYFLGKANFKIATSRIIDSVYNALRCRCGDMIPDNGGRFAVVILINFTNISLGLYGVLFLPTDFEIFFLGVLLMNFAGYFVYYLVSKIYYKEHWRTTFLIYLILALVLWGLAAVCFTMAPTDWEKSPALSREKNSDCIVADFFDVHDLWHFLSSFALFFSFMAVQTVDDDIEGHDSGKTIKIF